MRSILSITLCFLFLAQCQESKPSQTTIVQSYQRLRGETMGTTYSVIYNDPQQRNFQKDLDQLLVDINKEVNTYDSEAFISKFNQSEIGIAMPKGKYPHFEAVYEKAKIVNQQYDGFDPTVGPIVNYWGFGYTGKNPITQVDRLKVDTLLQVVGFQKHIIQPTQSGADQLQKTAKGVQLDFGAIAKGYAVDALGDYLKNAGCQDFMVEIGGEVVCQGKNDKGTWWRLGINTPKEEAGLMDFEMVVQLENCALATSGNYRNFYEVDGQKYSHTINPKTGFPERSNLLSTSVFVSNCTFADAYATAFMVMGLEAAFDFAENAKDLEAVFIYADENGNLLKKFTGGMERYIVE